MPPDNMDAMFSRWRFLLTLVLGLATTLLLAAPTFTRILPLKPEEGVFAYARISPDGQLLSYASERHMGGQFKRTVNVVNLATKEVLFSEPGMDAYWAPDGKHLIYLSQANSEEGSTCLWVRDGGAVLRDVAPSNLGHYFTWGRRDGRDVVLTQNNRYWDMVELRAARPYRTVPAFPPLSAGTQPMLSKDARLIATFHRGTLLVRALDEAKPVVETRLRGGKADFSYDGRYIAFHSLQKVNGKEAYQVLVVDLRTRELLKVTELPGSCTYPSWTRDGRLVFRYDAADYRGFLMATRVLDAPRSPLPKAYPDDAPEPPPLARLYPKGNAPRQRVVIVNFWAGWCVHCRAELPMLHQLRKDLRAAGADAELVGACDPTSFQTDRDFILSRSKLDIPQVDLTAAEVNAYGIQVYPTTLIFVEGRVAVRHAGALTRAQALALLKAQGIALP